MRKVKVYKYERKKGHTYYDKVYDYTAIFHKFGFDYEEFETGPGNYTTGIIELEDGNLLSVDVALLQFVTPSQIKKQITKTEV